MITIWPELIQSDQYFVNIELQAGPDGAEDDNDDGDDDVIYSFTYVSWNEFSFKSQRETLQNNSSYFQITKHLRID